MDREALFGLGWMSDDWWAEAVATGLLAVENHSWDHPHPDHEPDLPPGDGADVENLQRATEFITSRQGASVALEAL